MLDLFNVSLNLNYNRVAVFNRIPYSEFRVMLDHPFRWTVDQHIPQKASGGSLEKVFKNQYFIEIGSRVEDVCGNHCMPEPYFYMSIDHYLGEDEKTVYHDLLEIVDRICIKLTLEINRHNCNRQRYQPRIIADWSHAEWNQEEYQETGNIAADVEKINSNMSMHSILSVHLSEEYIDYKDWAIANNSQYEFLMKEYYIALGEENPKSKFFHLFCIIEYIEHAYENYNEARFLCSEDLKREVKETLIEILKSSNDYSRDERNRISNSVMNTLSKTTNIGRADKLCNILKWMNIEKLVIHDYEIKIDKKMMNEIINLRNETFHGAGKGEEDYIQICHIMLYLCEMILDKIPRS